MNSFPDFSNYGYQVIRELGHNRAGGRITYLATEINTGHSVVVKQFQFARTRTSASWSDYQAYEQEINVLRSLDHPSIPRYLDSFQTSAGFCMVQEYKNAPSLATQRTWTPEQVKQIAILVLEIIQYLQSQIPPVIHRDLKPENILVDEQMNVYLVDFGFARTGGGEVAVSSVVKGTLGFMPPEQMFNRQLTVASDLYSLGATLICLLTNTVSTEVGSLIDESSRMNFKQRVPHLSQDFINWLQKMVEPNFKDRYSSAEAALDSLVPLQILRSIQVPKLVWIRVGLVGVSVAVLLPLFINILSKLEFHTRLQVTTEPNSSENLKRLSITEERIYFSVSLENLEESEYNSSCQMFDQDGKLVAMGESTLNASSEGLKAWCWYDFQDADQPGHWTFKFSVDGQTVAQKDLEVLP
ncbi:MAG: serine/threonine-protein kinase [Coleofasciculus sp. C1-SOL-03]|uniref:serine/threonine protein kinase n=1 Tax=Coleofasciculus sp. C1-SOL-03 TaxID=3069522 RepID=UPI0032F738F8